MFVFRWTLSVCTLLSLLFLPQHSSAEPDRPNVIIILTDDQGLGDLSFYGNPVIETPHLDTLAGEGVNFAQFHVTSMCSPTRAALLTGKNPLENGVISTCQGLHSLRHETLTMAEAFSGAGYATGIFGKWHLGRNWPNRPEDRGFQESFTLYGFGQTGISSRWNNDYVDTWVVHNGEEKQTEGFCTDAFFNPSMDWMKKQAQAGKPFFAYISTNAPHFPFWAPEEWTKPFAETDNPEFFAMVKNIDDNLGRLEEFLSENGLRENTILVFLTDNGTVGGKSTFNAGMKGNKATPWEGGHRVPLFVRYPAGEVEGGRTVEGLADVTDIFPTLMDLCEIEPANEAEFSGVSLVSALRGESELPDRILTMHIQQHELRPLMAAVMYQDWRLLWTDALYDLSEDPMQEVNAAEERPDIFYKLWSHYISYYHEYEEAATTPQPEVIGGPEQDVVVLDASYWIGGPRADGQINVRLAQSKRFGPEGAPWKIEADASGIYEISLRRWPVESGLKLDEGAPPFQSVCSGEPVPAGVALPIRQASLDVNTVRYVAAPFPEDPTAVTFKIEMAKGVHELHGIFRDAEGQPLCGAFYAYVRRFEESE